MNTPIYITTHFQRILVVETPSAVSLSAVVGSVISSSLGMIPVSMFSLR